MAERSGPPRTKQHDALRRLRRSLDDKITAASGDPTVWVGELATVIQKLDRVFARHIKESEGPDGSLREILQIKPHLQKRVKQVQDEHPEIQGKLASLMADIERETKSNAIDVEGLRSRAGALQEEIQLHQARGVDLIYEAYYRVEGSAD